ncbi:hypothetical protein K437DRAFT_275321 [Tilletiaria anomala UBC 951]|uniref:Uncharacterized protein n=1 Tax=Tilletiaria anomala (strain ATCC 24038 / CBS 436.72 / UBC 951) TaxID=1037660 RepID=A0A066VTL1_TILAU|nr:uncharacterized protein K437DRAFT_275321 [Tilletiaria anomala UBC 951]KDN41875.1 hypothetical protein K437DRAFT_275321 [Tilletiaria anomala UBC 951]
MASPNHNSLAAYLLDLSTLCLPSSQRRWRRPAFDPFSPEHDAPACHRVGRPRQHRAAASHEEASLLGSDGSFSGSEDEGGDGEDEGSGPSFAGPSAGAWRRSRAATVRQTATSTVARRTKAWNPFFSFLPCSSSSTSAVATNSASEPDALGAATTTDEFDDADAISMLSDIVHRDARRRAARMPRRGLARFGHPLYAWPWDTRGVGSMACGLFGRTKAQIRAEQGRRVRTQRRTQRTAATATLASASQLEGAAQPPGSLSAATLQGYEGLVVDSDAAALDEGAIASLARGEQPDMTAAAARVQTLAAPAPAVQPERSKPDPAEYTTGEAETEAVLAHQAEEEARLAEQEEEEVNRTRQAAREKALRAGLVPHNPPSGGAEQENTVGPPAAVATIAEQEAEAETGRGADQRAPRPEEKAAAQPPFDASPGGATAAAADPHEPFTEGPAPNHQLHSVQPPCPATEAPDASDMNEEPVESLEAPRTPDTPLAKVVVATDAAKHADELEHAFSHASSDIRDSPSKSASKSRHGHGYRSSKSVSKRRYLTEAEAEAAAGGFDLGYDLGDAAAGSSEAQALAQEQLDEFGFTQDDVRRATAAYELEQEQHDRERLRQGLPASAAEVVHHHHHYYDERGEPYQQRAFGRDGEQLDGDGDAARLRVVDVHDDDDDDDAQPLSPAALGLVPAAHHSLHHAGLDACGAPATAIPAENGDDLGERTLQPWLAIEEDEDDADIAGLGFSKKHSRKGRGGRQRSTCGSVSAGTGDGGDGEGSSADGRSGSGSGSGTRKTGSSGGLRYGLQFHHQQREQRRKAASASAAGGGGEAATADTALRAPALQSSAAAPVEEGRMGYHERPRRGHASSAKSDAGRPPGTTDGRGPSHSRSGSTESTPLSPTFRPEWAGSFDPDVGDF